MAGESARVLVDAAEALRGIEETIESFRRKDVRDDLAELGTFVMGLQQLDRDLRSAAERLRQHLPDPDKTPVEPLTARAAAARGSPTDAALHDALESLRRLRQIVGPVDRLALLRHIEQVVEVLDALDQVRLDMRMAGFRLKALLAPPPEDSAAGTLTPLRPPSGLFPSTRKR